jgi:hypothetical protein
MDAITPEDLDLLHEHLSPDELALLDSLLVDGKAARERYRTDPVAFVEEVLGVTTVAPYQRRILEAILKHRRVCVRSLHGIGKTTVSAWIVLWFTAVHDQVKVPTTASAWRQLKEFLWPEIHKWALKADWSKIDIKIRLGRELLAQRLVISPTAFAFALNSVDEAKIEGAHSENILYLFDEAKTIPPEIWDAAEGALSTDGSYAVALSTPGDSIGRFYDIQMKKPGFEDWHTVHVTLEEAIAAGRVNRDWAEKRKAQWGESGMLYRRRVLGEFAEDEAETVISLSMVERAQARWDALMKRVDDLVANGSHTQDEALTAVWGPLQCLGVDPARMGRDRTGYAYRHVPGILKIERTSKQDLMSTTGRVVAITRDTDGLAHIDPIGLGAGVYDRLNELWITGEWRSNEKTCPAKAINVGIKTKFTDRTGQFRFRLLRDFLWWNMREILESDEIALPPDDELVQDLIAAKYKQLSDGTIMVESKDEMREHLPEKRSPDVGDAVMLSYFPEVATYKPQIAFL